MFLFKKKKRQYTSCYISFWKQKIIIFHLESANNVEGCLYQSYTFLVKNEQSCELQIDVFFSALQCTCTNHILLNEPLLSNITLVYNYCTVICQAILSYIIFQLAWKLNYNIYRTDTKLFIAPFCCFLV